METEAKREAGEGNEMRGREHGSAGERGGDGEKSKAKQKEEREWIVNVRGKQSGRWGWK